MRKYLIIFVVVIVSLTGCSANQSKKGYCHEKGHLSAYLYQPSEDPCKVNFRYRNLSKNIQQPVIDIILYNEAKELISHDKLYFDKMGPGSARQLTEIVECKGENISKIFIRDAVNSSRCYGYKCSKLCGINRLSIDVLK